MIKKYSYFLFALLLLFTGCFNNVQESTQPSVKTDESKIEASLSVLDLKKKYGVEDEKAIMPMYNVAYNEEFTFKFNSDLSEINYLNVISVHTDSKALEESKIHTFVNPESYMPRPTELTVKPVAGVLTSSHTINGSNGWGNAPIYYIRVNYDLDSNEVVELDKPLIIPFTVKSEVKIPNLKHEISKDGRLKLVWDEVEGADEYRVYNVANYGNLLETSNLPITGAEKGYVGVFPLHIGTVNTTEFDDFMKDGNSGLNGVLSEGVISYQNFGVNGEYFVTAVKGDKESNFSTSVNTTIVSDKLPLELVDNINLELFNNVNDLPIFLDVKMVDGSIVRREVIYDTDNIDIKEFGDTTIYFNIKNTAINGYVRVSNIKPTDIDSLTIKEKAVNGNIEITNTTDYVPEPEIPTIIESEEKEQDEPTNIVEEQKENTLNHVEEGNNAVLEVPEISNEIEINVSSALEEYLALQLMNAENEISLKAFPEVQNFDRLVDVMQKVIYQNPLILGVSQFGYDYGSLTLFVEYEDSADVIKQKQEEIVVEAKAIINKIIQPNMNDDEKRMAIYNYLADNTEYDFKALESAEQNNFKEVDSKYNDSFTTYGIMVKKVGVCMSYSYTYKMLSDLAGLNSIVVTGMLNGNLPHAWNKVKIDDNWLHVDVTNNEKVAGIPYMLYNTNDETAQSMEWYEDDLYWLDDELHLFEGKSNSNDYYVVNGLEVNSLNDYQSKVTDELKNGNDFIVIRYVGTSSSNDLANAAADAYYKTDSNKINNAKIFQAANYVIITHRDID